MQEALLERLRLEADIVRALANGEFFLEYQPVVTLDTRRLLGVEALASMATSRSGDLLTPQGLHPGGRGVGPRHRAWALGAAAGMRRLAALVRGDGRRRRACSRRERVGPSPAAGRPGAGRRHRAPEHPGLDPGCLVLELTESTIMHNTAANLERLHAAEGARRPTCDRRLRHRLLVTGLPAPVPDRHPEDRSLLRQPAGRWRGPGAGACGRDARADAGPRHGCRGY